MSDEPTDSVHEPLVGAPAPHSGGVRAGDDAILAKDDSVLNLGVGDVDVASKAAVTGPCLPVCFPYYPGGICDFSAVRPDFLWTSNFVSNSTLFAVRAGMITYLLLLFFWTGTEHAKEAGQAILHLSLYAHLLFAMYLKFGVAYSSRAAFYEVKPLCDSRDRTKELEDEQLARRYTHNEFDFAAKWAWTVFELCYTFSATVALTHWIFYQHDGSTLNNFFLSIHNRGFTFFLVNVDLMLSRLRFIPQHVNLALLLSLALLGLNLLSGHMGGTNDYYFIRLDSQRSWLFILAYLGIVYACFQLGVVMSMLRDMCGGSAYDFAEFERNGGLDSDDDEEDDQTAEIV